MFLLKVMKVLICITYAYYVWTHSAPLLFWVSDRSVKSNVYLVYKTLLKVTRNKEPMMKLSFAFIFDSFFKKQAG